MTNNKIVMSLENKKFILKSIDELINFIQNEDDLKNALTKSLNRVSTIQSTIKTIADFENTPENRFISYILWDLFNLYKGIAKISADDEWLQENNISLEKFKMEFLTFLNNINANLKQDSFEQTLQSSKNFFYEAYNITQNLSARNPS